MATTTQAQQRAVLVTGAAGGIGSAAVRQLDASGFQVFAGIRNASDGEMLQRTISAKITPVLLDITDATSVATAVATITQAVGNTGLSGLVNNAGFIVEGPVELIPMTEVRRQFEVNVIGHIAVTQAFLPLLRKAQGRIVNIGAPTSRISFPYMGVLSASKAALGSITDALRVELRPWGIAVSIIDPMAMQTKVFEKAEALVGKIRQQLPDQHVQMYASGLAAVSKAQAQQHMDDPAIVATAILHALTASKPKTRYAVGRGAGMVGILRLLPDHMRDRLLLRLSGLADAQPAL